MSKGVRLPAEIKKKTRNALKPGKGWRLVNPKRNGSIKAQCLATFSASGDRFVLFRVRG